MADLLRTMIIGADGDSIALVRRALAAHPAVTVVGEVSQPSEVLYEAASRRPDLVIVDLGVAVEAANPGTAARLIESLARTLPGTAIFVIGPSASAEFVIQIMRAGALEFIGRPVQRDDLFAALDKVLRLRRGGPEPRRPGHLISVFSPKGGLGVTTVATNLAVCLADRAPGKTILVDLDRRYSDAATFLNLQPTYSVLDALENLDRLDESFLRGLLTKHASGLAVLPGPSRMERSQISGAQVEAGLAIIRSCFDEVVLDLRHDLDPGTLAALEASDTILFLISLDVPTLRSGAAAVAALRLLGLDVQKLRIVVMRENASTDVTLRHARETLGLPIFWRIPSDYPAVVASLNRGEPLVTASPRSKVAKNLRELAGHLSHGPAPSGPNSPRRATVLGRLIWSPKPLPGDA